MREKYAYDCKTITKDENGTSSSWEVCEYLTEEEIDSKQQLWEGRMFLYGFLLPFFTIFAFTSYRKSTYLAKEIEDLELYNYKH